MGLCYGQMRANGVVSMGLCYGQVCASGQSANGFVLWLGVCTVVEYSMGLAMVRAVPVVSQHETCAMVNRVVHSGQSAWVCAMVRCVPVVSQHGLVLHGQR